jgi:hypothetical protein
VRDAQRQVVFIGGAQRSGTTLLQTVLANALGAANLPEAHILCDLMAAYKRAKEHPRKTEYFYSGGDDLLAFFRSCSERHITDLIGRFGGGTTIVLKDPNFVRFDEELRAVFPDAIRIAMLRDPRDIAASFIRIGQRKGQSGEAGNYRRRDLLFVGRKILGSYERLMQGPGGSAHLVKYEDLVVNVPAALEALAGSTGLDLPEVGVGGLAWLETEARHKSSWVSELEGQAPSDASVGSYRRLLWPHETAAIEYLCAPYMRWAGYEASVERTWWEAVTIASARRIVELIGRGYHRFYRRGLPQP